MAIETGDTVKNNKLPDLNGGMMFSVIDVDGDKALCEFVNSNSEIEKEWFDIADLVLVNKYEGGFL